MIGMAQSKRVRDLQRLLEQLRSLHDELFTLVDAKIVAMRRADVPALTECSAREITLVQRLTERESFRAQLMDAIGAELRLPPRTGRTMSISQLVERLEDSEGGALLTAAEQLRRAVMKVAQANRVCGAVSLELVNHLRWVLAAVRPRGEKPTGYAGDGALVGGDRTALLELVG